MLKTTFKILNVRGWHGCVALMALAFAAGLLAGCDNDSSTTPSQASSPPAPAPEPEPEPPPETANYNFAQPEALISPRVPGSLPEGVNFAGDLVFVTHAAEAHPWQVGETASDAMKTYVETGDHAALLAEAEAAGGTVVATNLAELLGLFLSEKPVIAMTLEAPCATYVQRIEPSSDWFAGLSVCAFDEEDGWAETLDIDMLAYDAGTAEGADYAAKESDTDPREPIALLDRPPHFTAPAVVQRMSATLLAE